MYLRIVDSPYTTTGIVVLLHRAADWIATAYAHLEIVPPALYSVWEWLVRVSPVFRKALYHVFERPSEWPVQALYASNNIFKTHLHAVYLISLSLFFGPIVALLPLLLLHELAIWFLFNVTFLVHGLIPGSVARRYDSLRSRLSDTRESLFASVDEGATIFNKWTTQFTPLVILRIFAFAIGCYAFVEIWNGLRTEKAGFVR